MKFRVNFLDKNSDETRSLVVDAANEDCAEEEGEREADRRGWPSSFRVADAEEVER